jgi:hypothetical protein
MSYGLPRRGAWRSLVSALVWGTKGRRFESGRPDWECGTEHLSRGISVALPESACGALHLDRS